MNRKSVTGLMAGLLMTLGVGVASPAALAHGGGPMMDRMGAGMMDGMGHMGMKGGMGPIGMLDLNDDQQAKLREIENDLRKQNWGAMGKMMDQESELEELFRVDKRDPKAIGAVYAKIFDLKRQLIEAKIAATNNMQAVLTKEQREQLKKMRRSKSGGMEHGGGKGGMEHGGGKGSRNMPHEKGMMGGCR